MVRPHVQRGDCAEAYVHSLKHSSPAEILDALPAFVAYVDPELVYVFANRAYRELMGQGDIVGWPLAEVMTDDMYQALRPRLQTALRGEEQAFRWPRKLAGGAIQWLSARYLPDAAPDGTIAGLYVLVDDVTAEQEAVEELRQGEARYRTLTDLAPVGILHADSDGAIWLNGRCAEICQLPPNGPIPSAEWMQLLHPDDAERVIAQWAEAMDQGEPRSSTYRLMRPDGEAIWIQGKSSSSKAPAPRPSSSGR